MLVALFWVNNEMSLQWIWYGFFKHLLWMRIHWNVCATLWSIPHHFYVNCFRHVENSTLGRKSLGACYERLISKNVRLNKLSAQSHYHWQLYLMLYLICQNHDDVEQGRFFSFNHILCSYVLPFIHVNWIQLIATTETCMFLETSATANHINMHQPLQTDICENSWDLNLLWFYMSNKNQNISTWSW